MRKHFSIVFCFLAAIVFGETAPRADELYRLGAQEFAQTHYEEAIASFREAARASGDSCAKCYFGISNAYLRMGNPSASLKNADTGIQQAKDRVERAAAHDLKGRILLLQAGNNEEKLDRAEMEFQEAVTLNPARVEARFNLGLTLLREYKDEDGLREIRTYLADAPNGENADWARKLLAHPNRVRDTFAPNFKITTAQGETLSLDQLAGKFVILDFWATWCPPCIASLGDLQQLQKQYSGRLVLISVSSEEDHQAWQHFLDDHKPDWPQYFDTNHRLVRMFGVAKLPTYIVIDGDGAIVERVIGVDSKTNVFAQLKTAVDHFLAQNANSPLP